VRLRPIGDAEWVEYGRFSLPKDDPLPSRDLPHAGLKRAPPRGDGRDAQRLRGRAPARERFDASLERADVARGGRNGLRECVDVAALSRERERVLLPLILEGALRLSAAKLGGLN
jgi:hypothetical protein